MGVGTDSAGDVVGAVAGEDGDAEDFGIFSLSPTLMRSVLRLFASRIALTVVLCVAAILESVSPDFTV